MGAMVGSIIYIIGLLIAGGFAVDRLFNPTELQQLGTLFGAFYMMVEVSIDGWQWRRNLRLARKKYSPIIEMQWRANRADTFFGLAVFLSLLLTIALQAFSWSIYIDPISALILVVYAIYLFFPSLTSGFDDLIDKTLKEELQILIVRRLAETFDGYDTFHDVRSRRSGGRILIDIGLSFSPEKTVREIMETVNQLTHKIENDIVDSEVRVAILPMPPMVSKQEPGCHGA
jgi:ferrous-iron efflux pump FieF